MRRRLVPKAIGGVCAAGDDNPVGARAAGVGCARRLAALFAAALLVGCGARSGLDDGSSIVAKAACPAASTAPMSTRLGNGNIGAIAVDAAGHPVLAGTATGPLELGSLTVDAPSVGIAPAANQLPGTPFLLKTGDAGCASFASTFTATQPAAIPLVQSMGVATGTDGGVLLTVNHASPIDFGGGPVGASPYGPSATIARFRDTGQHVFSRAFAASQAIAVARPAHDALGNVYVTGTFVGSLTSGSESLGASTPDRTDGFVVKLDASGALAWIHVLRLDADAPWETDTGTKLSVVAWPDGTTVVSGIAVANGLKDGPGILDLGGGPISFMGPAGVATSFDASGTHRWQSLVDVFVADAELDDTGAVMLVGEQDAQGIPVVRVSADGAMLGQSVFPAASTLTAFAAGAAGDMLGATVESADLVVTKTDASGNAVWTRMFPAAGGLPTVLPIFAPLGTPLLAGGFSGSLDLGTGALSAHTAPDGSATPNAFFAVLAP